MKEIKYTIIYCGFVRTFVMPFYFNKLRFRFHETKRYCSYGSGSSCATLILMVNDNLILIIVQLKKCPERVAQPRPFMHTCEDCDFNSAYPRLGPQVSSSNRKSSNFRNKVKNK